MQTYDPARWYWIVADDDTKWWSSAAGAYVAPIQSWLDGGNLPSRIADEVELNSVLLTEHPACAMTRTFAPTEVMAALDRIDTAQTAAAFTAAEIAAPTTAMAGRLTTLATALGVRLGTIAG